LVPFFLPMQPVFDVYSRQNFESMKLAGEICNIPASKIKESIDKGVTIKSKDGRKYLFKKSSITITKKFYVKTFPFGKYKGKSILDCTDKEYLQWFIKLDILNPHVRQAIKGRLNEINNLFI